MEREPKGFPPLLLASLLVVVLAGAAGYLLWWLTAHRAPDAPPPVEADLAGVTLEPVEHLATTPAHERQRVDEIVEGLLFRAGPRAKSDPKILEPELVGQGEVAVPPVLRALHRLHAQDAFAGKETRTRAAVADRVLRQVRRRIPGAQPPLGTMLDGDDEPGVVERRAKAWFLWWRERTAASPRAER